MAFVTRSLASRTAMSGSTGARQRSRAARTWRRASATAAGPAVRRTGSPGISVGRGGAIKLRHEGSEEQRLRLKMEGVGFRGKLVDMDAHEYQFRMWEEE